MNPESFSRGRGFTLIELLAVIVVIAVIAALLLPALGRAHQRAHRSRCESNLRQIQVACTLYAADHGGLFPSAACQHADLEYLPNPPSDPWLQNTLASYVSGATGSVARIFRCPGVRIHWLAADGAANHYRYNVVHAAGAQVGSLRQAGRAVLAFDAAWRDWSPQDLPHDGVNLVFADGHVEFMDSAAILAKLAGTGTGDDLRSPFMSDGWP